MPLSNDEFRERLRRIQATSGLSMRQLSAAMGRDAGYVAALLDPSRPTRARPSPDDLLRLSDVTGIPFVELLGSLWGIPTERLRRELLAGAQGDAGVDLSEADRRQLADYAAYLAQRSRRP